MLENLSNNFKKVFEYLKSKGIHEIWVSKDVDFSSEYPVVYPYREYGYR